MAIIYSKSPIIQGDFSFVMRARGWKFVPLISQLYLGNVLCGSLFGRAAMCSNETHSSFVCVCAWNRAVVARDGSLPLKNMLSTMLRQKQKWQKCNLFCSNYLKNMHQILLYGAFSTDGMFPPCGGNGWRTLALPLVGSSHKRSWITSRSCECEITLKQAPHNSKPTKTPSPT